MPLVTLPGFDEAVARHSYKGSRAVLPYHGRRHCSRCSFGELIRLGPVTQMSLFYHGGYGAAERKTIDLCLACGRTQVVHKETVNPRRVPNG